MGRPGAGVRPICGHLMRGPEMHRTGVPRQANRLVLPQQSASHGRHLCLAVETEKRKVKAPGGTKDLLVAQFLPSVL